MTSGALDELLARLNRGDLAAAEEVYRTYAPYLRKVVRRLLPARLRPKFDSVDVVQSAWRDVLAGLQTADWHFANVQQLRAFLVRVTRNRFIDRARQHGTAAAREQPLDETAPERLSAVGQPDPGEAAQASELWDRLLALCPAEHREVLLLRREGLDAEEIGRCTGLHPGSVRRVLRTLAARLAASQTPPQPP